MKHAASADPVPAPSSGLGYGLLGLPLAFVALPLYVILPNHYARNFAAPLAALAAVVVPEVVMTQGQLISTWRDARLFAAAAGAAYFWWRRGILGTILSGMAVLLPLRLGLGW